MTVSAFLSRGWLDDLRRDAVYTARMLRRNPITTATAALSLAIGIGANTAIFTVANALLLRNPVGVADPDRVVDIGVKRDDGGLANASYPTYVDIRRRATTLSGVYAHEMFPHAMSLGAAGNGGAESVFGHYVTTSYFTVLGASPAAGRLFDEGDGEEPGASPVAVLSHGFWSRRFNRDPAVVGQTIRLNGLSFIVVGVAPEGFQGTGILAGDLWIPLNMAGNASSRRAMLANRHGGWLVIGGRVKPGFSIPQAAAELDTIGEALDREYPPPAPAGPRGLRLRPSSRAAGNSRIIAAFVALLMIIVALVLVVACANVAGMLLARAAARRREVAVRLAIGAGRARLVRQLLTETLMLFVLAGAAGLLLARAMTTLMVPLLPAMPFPVSITLALDGRVIAFTMGLSLAAAILSGLVPALQASKTDVLTALKDDSSGSSHRSRLRDAFVMAQVALSILLVVATGLFGRALQKAGSVDPGFDPRGVELASLDLSMAGYTDITAPRFHRELIERLRRLPEVQAATLARVLPGGFEGIGLGTVTVPGFTAPNGDGFLSPAWNIVAPTYFATLRIPLVAGRDFNAADSAGAQPVAVIGEAIARRLWPGQNAVGQPLSWVDVGPSGPHTQTLLVVGVARDVKSSSLIDGLAEAFVYLPLQQHYASRMTANMTIAARTTRGQRVADDIRAVVLAMNPNLPIVTSQTLEDATKLGLVPQRIAASASGSLGLVGLLLAAIGIYGVTAYTVTRRTREFGIRIALGAQRAEIMRLVLREGLRLAVIGSAIGLALAAAASRVLVVFLFGVSPNDPVIFGGATALFIAIGLAACCGPARRATNVDPVVALRYD